MIPLGFAAVGKVRAAAIIRQRKLIYYCRLYLKIRILKWLRTTTRSQMFALPVETVASPYSVFYSILTLLWDKVNGLILTEL